MNHVKQQGFTLIELMLAMAFVSALLLGIALTVLQISQIYTKGITTTELNEVARSITSDLSRSVSSSEAASLDAESYRQLTSGGRLCLGQYSYIWNYGEAIDADSKDSSYSTYSSDVDRDDIRFVRAVDVGGTYCAGDADKDIDPNSSVELLSQTDRNLVIHDFSITSPDSVFDGNTGQRLYVVSFTVGTNNLEALTDDRTECKQPGLIGSDLQYCTIQEFTIVLRAQNAVN